ncbi:MAG: type II toxin-antitoxin system RelB/DinJ family antitoxin [Candidatus Cloacimonetes bacterium]|nr:type II toxin-antitoxin system RelB/DinJ family antitoxin [Candidatus Cloacimonadota bacterium]
MIKSAMLRARIEPILKEEVDSILKELGLSTSEAINLFYKQIKLRKGLPFKVVIPNDLTQKTMKETDNNLNLIESETTEEMFNKLGI